VTRPAIDRVIALTAVPTRPGGDGSALRRTQLAKLVHQATDGLIPLLDAGPGAVSAAAGTG
jgi:hypothetical protein